VRHTGLPPDLAGHELAGTSIGRLWLAGKITTLQREAGDQYMALRAAMLRAIKAPDGLAATDGRGAPGDLVTDNYVAWAVAAVARYKVVRGWLCDAALAAVVDSVVVDGRECDEATLPYLVRGLQVLADRMGIS